MTVEREAKDPRLAELLLEYGNAEFACGVYPVADTSGYKKKLLRRNFAKNKLLDYLENEK